MDFSSNDKNEIFFVDGAERSLDDDCKDAFTSASAHFLELFGVNHEVDVYVSQRSILHKFDSNALAWHKPPSYNQNNSVVCVYVDPKSSLEEMMTALAHEMIHVWQVDRGDLLGANWKGENLSQLAYQFQPWEIEAHGNQDDIVNFFYNDTFPDKSFLRDIQLKTDIIFEEMINEGISILQKDKLKKIGKLAATLGFGALLGM